MKMFAQNSIVRMATFKLIQTIEFGNCPRIDFSIMLLYVRTKAKLNGYLVNIHHIKAKEVAAILVELGYSQYNVIANNKSV